MGTPICKWKMALDFTVVFVAVLCDAYVWGASFRIYCFWKKNGEELFVFCRSADAAWNFSVSIDLGEQQSISGLLFAGNGTCSSGWADGRSEDSGEAEKEKIDIGDIVDIGFHCPESILCFSGIFLSNSPIFFFNSYQIRRIFSCHNKKKEL